MFDVLEVPLHEALLVLRVLLKATQDKGDSESPLSEALEVLVSHTEQMRQQFPSYYVQALQLGKLIHNMVQEQSPCTNLSARHVTRLLLQIRLNAIEYVDGRGAGIFLQLAAMNHSCAPNCYVYCTKLLCASNNNQQLCLVVRVACDVRAGEQLSFCYLGHHALFRDRLLRTKLFVCCCARCHQNEVDEKEEGREESREDIQGNKDNELSRVVAPILLMWQQTKNSAAKLAARVAAAAGTHAAKSAAKTAAKPAEKTAAKSAATSAEANTADAAESLAPTLVAAVSSGEKQSSEIQLLLSELAPALTKDWHFSSLPQLLADTVHLVKSDDLKTETETAIIIKSKQSGSGSGSGSSSSSLPKVHQKKDEKSAKKGSAVM